jgi:RNA polymerase sigma-70 factor (ECF subfamily)
VARRFGCSDADADEIVQDTFWRVWKSANKWEPGRAKVSTWLYKLAANRTIDYHRAATRRHTAPIGEDQEFVDEAANAEQSFGDRQRLSAMQAAITELPDRQRMAIILSTQQDKSNTEIAEILGGSVGAIEQLMVRARKTLRDQHRRLE